MTENDNFEMKAIRENIESRMKSNAMILRQSTHSFARSDSKIDIKGSFAHSKTLGPKGSEIKDAAKAAAILK